MGRSLQHSEQAPQERPGFIAASGMAIGTAGFNVMLYARIYQIKMDAALRLVLSIPGGKPR